MIDVLLLERLQRDLRFPQDLVLPGQELGAEIIALALVHERLFFGRSIVLQLFQGQPIFHLRRRALAAPREEEVPLARRLYSEALRQTILARPPSPPGQLPAQANLSGGAIGSAKYRPKTDQRSAKDRPSLVNSRR